MNIDIEGPLTGQGQVCESILKALPEWFGDLPAVGGYVDDSEKLSSFVVLMNDVAVGLLTFKYHFEKSAEIVVMAILPKYHRQGFGRALIQALETHLCALGVEYVQVKTLDKSAKSDAYDSTRQFYQNAGFTPLEVWPTVWSPGNPCLQMVKHLDSK